MIRFQQADTLAQVQEGDADLIRVAVIIGIAILAHLIVRLAKQLIDRGLGSPGVGPGAAVRHPKLATLASLGASAATFSLWFVAFGLTLGELGVNLTAYFATATVIGLAVGFGSQGLVQDVVIGLTLIFTDALDVGDVVEVSGQVGRVERIGLRFTTLTNFLGQTVFIPNRNIAVVARYRRGVVRAYADVQLPDPAPSESTVDPILAIARGLREQHPAAIVSEPELMGIRQAETGGWSYARIKFRIWPGQQALVETAFRQRVVAHLKATDEKYTDWMVTVTYRVS